MENKKEKRHISYTQLNMFLRCARQYEYRYIKGIRRPPSGALVVGRSWHEAVELNYRQKIQTGEDLPLGHVTDCFSDSFEKAFNEEVELKEGENPGRLKDTGIQITEVHHQNIAPMVQPLEVEKEFVLDLGPNFPYVLKGFWDLIEKHGIVDNKSYSRVPSQSDVDRDIQLTIYSTAYRAIYQKIEPELRLDCVIKNKVPRVAQLSTTRTNADCTWLLGLVEKVAMAIKGGIFPPNPCGWHCSPKFCGFWELCKKK